MRLPIAALVVFVALAIPTLADAWSSGCGGPCFPVTFDSPGVIITATPQTITAGESTYVTFSAPLAIENVTTNPQPDVEENCTTNFTYTAIPYTQYGSPYGTMGATTESPTVTKTYTATCRLFVSESQSGVTYEYETASVTVTVNAPVASDLTAGAVSPTTATGGYSTTLSSTVSNGGAATSAGFTTLFQRANDASGTGAQDIGTYVRSTSLGAASNFAATLAYAFPAVTSTQTYYVRACADKSSTADTGALTESNETNNCSAWTAVTVSASGAQCSDTADNDGDGLTDTADGDCSSPGDTTEGNPGSVSCTVDSANVTVGGTTTYRASGTSGAGAPYTWTSSGQTGCTGGANNTCTFPVTGPYSMSVRATGNGNPTISCPAVTAGCAGPLEVSLTANGDEEETRVKDNGSATIAWDVSGTAAACSLTGTDGYSATVTPNACNATGSVSRTITTQTVYTLTCSGTSDSVIVNVETDLDEF